MDSLKWNNEGTRLGPNSSFLKFVKHVRLDSSVMSYIEILLPSSISLESKEELINHDGEFGKIMCLSLYSSKLSSLNMNLALSCISSACFWIDQHSWVMLWFLVFQRIFWSLVASCSDPNLIKPMLQGHPLWYKCSRKFYHPSHPL